MYPSLEGLTASLSFHLLTVCAIGVRARGWLRVVLAAVCLLVSLGTASLHAQTPSVTFAFANVPASVRVQKTLPTQGLGSPSGVAVDGAGNIFIADTDNNRVVDIPAGCATSACQVTIASGLQSPEDVAVDGAGNLYIVNNARFDAVEIPAGCTLSSCQITVANNLSRPEALALDSGGDVFIADTLHNRVVEVPAGCVSSNCQTTVGNGLSGPTGVAVDGAGDVFIADQSNGRVVEVAAGCASASCQSTVASGLSSPTGVAVDFAGDVFVTTSGTTAIEIPAGCTSSGCQMQLGSGLNDPQNLAVDQRGDVFIADTFNNRIVEEVIPSVDFGAVNVGSSSNLTLTFNINSDITLGTVPAVVTQGVSGLDFKLGGAAACTGEQTAGTTCTVTVQFSPLAPGQRQGAVQLLDSSGNLVTTTFINGTGQAPALAFTPGVQTNIGAVSDISGLAVDAAGNFFAAESIQGGQSLLLEFPAGGGAPVTLAQPGFNETRGVAVDGAGDVYITGMNGATQYLYEVPSRGTQQLLNIPANYIAVDGAGDLFYTDDSDGLSELPAGGSQSSTLAALNFSGTGIAFDGTGGFFVSDFEDSQVVDLPAGCTSSSCQTTITSVDGPWQLATDAAGDLFVAHLGQDSALELPAGGGAAIQVGTATETQGLAVDAQGDVFLTEPTGIVEVSRSQAAPLSFGTVLDGSSSAAKTVTIQNIGNQPLTFTSFTVDTSFQLDSSTTTCSTSSPLSPGAFCNVGVLCSPTTFNGALGGNLSIFDNTLNQTQGKQQVSLSCTASGQAPLITSANSTTFTAGTPGSFTVTTTGAPTPSLSRSGTLPAGVSFVDNHDGTATLSGTPAASAGGIYNITIIASNEVSPNATQSFMLTVNAPPQITSASNVAFTPGTAGTFSVTSTGYPTPALAEAGALPGGITFVDNQYGTATLSGTPAAGTSGSYSIVITASNGASPNASQSFTLTVNQASQTITFTLPSSVQAQTTLGLTGTASSGLPVTYTSSTQSVCSVSGSTATFLNGGTCTIVASQAGNSSYAAATPVSASTTVTAASQTITFTLPSSVQAQTTLTLTGTASSGLPVTYTSSTQSVCSVSGSTATFLTGGTCTIVASQAGNSSYAVATPVSASTKVTQTSQTITFKSLPGSALQGSNLTLSATATSGLAVSFTSLTPSVCSVSGSSATLLNAGTCTIQASQPGNASYAPATPVSQSVVVTAAFTITPTPKVESIRRGNVAAFILELQAASGFSGKVTLSCSGSPSGSYCVDFPMTVSFQKGVALAVSGIYFPPTTPPGTYMLTITGTSGSISNTTTAEFIVNQ